jgi:hypothetical protein
LVTAFNSRQSQCDRIFCKFRLRIGRTGDCPQTLPATLKDDRTTLTQWTEIQTDSNLDSIVQTTGRQLMPTASCFNFFPTAQKNLKFYCQHTFGTFAFVANAQSDTMAKAKEPNFPRALFTFIFTDSNRI